MKDSIPVLPINEVVYFLLLRELSSSVSLDVIVVVVIWD